MEISLKPIERQSRHILENMFQYYIYDMSEFMGWNPDRQGLYAYNFESLNPYWQKNDHVPYFIYAGSELAGFVLIRRYPGNQEWFDVEQFFILRKFKGHGIGKAAFALVVSHHPGKWQVRVLKENHGALSFWLSSVGQVTGNDFQKTIDIDVDLEMDFLRFDTQSH